MFVFTDEAPAPGQVAPDFTLKDQYGREVSLSDYRGAKTVVLMFYPAAFTGICTNELCGLRDRAPEFDAEDVVVLGISCDRMPSLKVFAAQEGIEYPLLSDFWPHGEVARAYGAFMESAGISTRATFVIDREGIVRWSIINGPGDARDIAQISAAVAEVA